MFSSKLYIFCGKGTLITTGDCSPFFLVILRHGLCSTCTFNLSRRPSLRWRKYFTWEPVFIEQRTSGTSTAHNISSIWTLCQLCSQNSCYYGTATAHQCLGLLFSGGQDHSSPLTLLDLQQGEAKWHGLSCSWPPRT